VGKASHDVLHQKFHLTKHGAKDQLHTDTHERVRCYIQEDSGSGTVFQSLHPILKEHFKFKYKIAIIFFGSQKRIGGIQVQKFQQFPR
jgi:hypothetical protein